MSLQILLIWVDAHLHTLLIWGLGFVFMIAYLKTTTANLFRTVNLTELSAFEIAGERRLKEVFFCFFLVVLFKVGFLICFLPYGS